MGLRSTAVNLETSVAELSTVIFASSPAMRLVAARLAEAAASRVGVLIAGEPGTGRSVIARAIHEYPGPGGGAFVQLDCSRVAPGDLPVELFGAKDVQVSADGALERVGRASLLYRARGGTLFLTHLLELPAPHQARLARVLRDREVVIAGSNDERRVDLDVRPIVSVGPWYQEAVDDGRIRQDLFRRFSAFRIDVPALRDRREDIPELTRYLLDDVCRIRGVGKKRLTAQATMLLAALPWKRNATELREVLEALARRVKEPTIRLRHVLSSVTLDGGTVMVDSMRTLRDARVRFEREYIAAVLAQHHGRVPDAARTLGIQRTNLYRKLRVLKLISMKSGQAAPGGRGPADS